MPVLFQDSTYCAFSYTVPLSLRSPAILPHCFLDLVRKRATGTSHSFHQYISSRYGRTLYREFFLPYTKKFLRWDPEDLHEDWGNAGINRSVIDERIKTGNLNDIIRLLVFPRRVRTEFLYPSSGGFGGFFEKLYHRCQLHRELFRAIFSEVISSLSYRDNRFTATTSGGKSLRFGKLIWSGNINDLLPLVSAERSFLPFLNTVFFYLICRSDAVRSHNAQWIYVSRGDTLISRITCMKEFAEYTCQKGYYNLVCEVTDSQLKQRYFEKPRLYTDVLLKELRGLGLLKNSKGVDAVEIRPVVDTYPIYHRHYVEEFRRALGDIHSFSEKIYLLGRCGSFWYNNTDHSIKMALELSRILLGNATGFSSREFPGGSYQEYIRFFEGKKNVL